MSAKNEFSDVQFKACEDADGTPYIGTHENGPKTNLVLNDKLSLALRLKRVLLMKKHKPLWTISTTT